MTLLLNTSIKVTLIVLVALAATAVLRRRSAGVRHFVLAAALACAAAVPALRIVAPAWQAGTSAWLNESRLQLIDRPLLVLDSTTAPTEQVPGAQAKPGTRAEAAVLWLGIIWVAGACASLFVLLAGLGRLAWLASRAERVTGGPWVRIAAEISRAGGLRRPPVLLQSSDAALLATWGFARAKVMLPSDVSDWPEDRIRIVLGHELAHVRRGDWLVQMAAEVVRCALLVQPARVGGVPPSAARKRAGVRRRRVEDGRRRIRRTPPSSSIWPERSSRSRRCFFPPLPSPARQASKGEFAPC